MNGRVYDPLLAMFLSPDNNLQSPDLTQNYNRYGYCVNNPLKYKDPSGFLSEGQWDQVERLWNDMVSSPDRFLSLNCSWSDFAVGGSNSGGGGNDNGHISVNVSIPVGGGFVTVTVPYLNSLPEVNVVDYKKHDELIVYHTHNTNLPMSQTNRHENDLLNTGIEGLYNIRLTHYDQQTIGKSNGLRLNNVFINDKYDRTDLKTGNNNFGLTLSKNGIKENILNYSVSFSFQWPLSLNFGISRQKEGVTDGFDFSSRINPLIPAVFVLWNVLPESLPVLEVSTSH